MSSNACPDPRSPVHQSVATLADVSTLKYIYPRRQQARVLNEVDVSAQSDPVTKLPSSTWLNANEVDPRQNSTVSDHDYFDVTTTTARCNSAEVKAGRRTGQQAQGEADSPRLWSRFIARILQCVGRAKSKRSRTLQHPGSRAGPPPLIHLEFSPPVHPFSPPPSDHIHALGASTSTATAEIPSSPTAASLHGVTHANVSGGTFYAAQTINIIVNPVYQSHSPPELTPPAHAPPGRRQSV
jgi:hypothetical protein